MSMLSWNISTEMPNSLQEGGSGVAASLSNEVHAACCNLLEAFVDLVTNDEWSPEPAVPSLSMRAPTAKCIGGNVSAAALGH